MAQWCLRPHEADKFKEDIINGKVNPESLSEMSSKERRTFFAERFGEENAEPMNRTFETKLLLKNKQQGYVTWANQLLVPKSIKRDLISRIERLDDRILDPVDEQSFLEDLAAQRLGTRVSYDEAGHIAELADNVENLESQKGSDDPDARLEYGRAVVDLHDYVNDLKHNSEKLTLADFKNRPIAAISHVLGQIPGTAKAIQASMDNSALFRQGWKVLWTNPMIWQRNARRSFVHLFGKYGPDHVMREVNADILSRPNADLYKRAKLDVGTTEESFPTTLPEKVPILGRAYKRTETAYTAFLHKTRADVFDKMIDIAKKTDVDLNDNEVHQIGRMVNSLTGRSDMGKAERASSAINSILFSPRMIKSHLDVLTQPLTGGSVKDAIAGQGSNFVRKQAALNLIKIISAQAAIFTIANALKPGAVELNPTSSDFGKIKVGNTRFDVTGGFGSLAVLAARMAKGQSKISTTGEVSDLSNPKYGGQTRLDVVEDFLENKLSPVAGVVRDFAKGQTFDHKKPTVGKESLNLVTPLPISNAIELLQDPMADNPTRVAGILADALGISSNTYGSSKATQRLIDDATKRGDAKEVERLGQIKHQQLKQETQDKKENKQLQKDFQKTNAPSSR